VHWNVFKRKLGRRHMRGTEAMNLYLEFCGMWHENCPMTAKMEAEFEKKHVQVQKAKDMV
jgi:hypothetical protein